MPELPEVETIRRGLAARITGRRVESVDWRGAALRRPSPLPLQALEGRRFSEVRRHGKFLILDLDDRSTLVWHLGMTGKILFARPDEPERAHTHLVLGLRGAGHLRYCDPRRFGMVRLHAPDETPDDTAHYGIDALDPLFTVDYLAAELAGSRAPLKAFLLDQTKVAGLGNIYACEALWRAGLSPRRLARNTPLAKVPLLHAAIGEVLEASMAKGGTSFNDYVDTIGEPGRFLTQLAVFQRDGEACPRCSRSVRRIVQSNRSTFYCPACQR